MGERIDNFGIWMRKKNEAGGLAGVQEFLVVSSSGGVVAGTLLNRNLDWSFFQILKKNLTRIERKMINYRFCVTIF
ncbi:MAG: hypothetical protein DWI24_01360 [Planctomycetota bacterium]|nr:MAG: hypothetical protein DWI24_01360 [Planctomycetota bacterium]